ASGTARPWCLSMYGPGHPADTKRQVKNPNSFLSLVVGSEAMSDALGQFSSAVAARTAAAAPLVASIELRDGSHLSATLWRGDLIVASEQSLPSRTEFDVVLPGGARATASVVGRDTGTNVALLKLASPVSLTPPPQAAPAVGTVALAYGADGAGGVT